MNDLVLSQAGDVFTTSLLIAEGLVRDHKRIIESSEIVNLLPSLNVMYIVPLSESCSIPQAKGMKDSIISFSSDSLYSVID